MKSCSTCGFWKSDGEFYIDRRLPKRSVDGRHHACKDCERAAALMRYHVQAKRERIERARTVYS